MSKADIKVNIAIMKKLLILIIFAIMIIAVGGGLAVTVDHMASILLLPLSFGLAVLVLVSAISSMPRRQLRSQPIFESLLALKLGDKDTVGYVFVHRLAATIGMGIMFLIVHIYYSTRNTQYVSEVSSNYGWTTIIPIELTMTLLLITFALGAKIITTVKNKWRFVNMRSIIK